METGTEIGTVVTLQLMRGFGFVRANGRDLFFHCKSLANSLAFDETLRERRVSFNVVTAAKGPEAVNLRPAK
jgi:cold shock CspA family protein